MSISQVYGSDYRGFIATDYGYKFTAKLGESNDPLFIPNETDTQLFPKVTLSKGVYSLNFSIILDTPVTDGALVSIYFAEKKNALGDGVIYLCYNQPLIPYGNSALLFINSSYVVDVPSSEITFFMTLNGLPDGAYIKYGQAMSTFRIVRSTP